LYIRAHVPFGCGVEISKVATSMTSTVTPTARAAGGSSGIWTASVGLSGLNMTPTRAAARRILKPMPFKSSRVRLTGKD